MDAVHAYFLRVGCSLFLLEPQKTVAYALFLHTHPFWFLEYEKRGRDRPLATFMRDATAFDPTVFAASLQLAADAIPKAVLEMPLWLEFLSTGIETMPRAAVLGFFLLGFAQQRNDFPTQTYVAALRTASGNMSMSKKTRSAIDKLYTCDNFSHATFCDLLARWGIYVSRPCSFGGVPCPDDDWRGGDAVQE